MQYTPKLVGEVFQTFKDVAQSVGFPSEDWQLFPRDGAWVMQRQDGTRIVDTDFPKHVGWSDQEAYDRLSAYIAALTAVRNLRSGG